MSCPKKAEIITISDSEEDETETEYVSPKRKADLFPFVSLKRINLIRTPFFTTGEVNDCTSHYRHHAESKTEESDKKEFEKIKLEKVTLQTQLDESKKKVEKQEEENYLINQKLLDANSIIESQKVLILKLQKDVEDNKSEAVKWESKFVKMKESMVEVNSDLCDLVESCIKDGSSQFRELDFSKNENIPGSNVPCTPQMSNAESQGQNCTSGSSDTLTNDYDKNDKHKLNGFMHIKQIISPDKKFKCDICKLAEYHHVYLLERHMRAQHGVKDLKRTNCGSDGENQATLMTHQRTASNSGTRLPAEKTTKITRTRTKEPAQIDNEDVRQLEPLDSSGRVESVKDEDSVKLETESKGNQRKRILPKRTRTTPLRFEEEFNTDFSIKSKRPKPKKYEKIPQSPRWPVSKLHGVGDCKNGLMCVCGNEFKGKTDLWNHIRLHNQRHRFSCFICGAGFNELEHAHRHVQELHRGHSINQ